MTTRTVTYDPATHRIVPVARLKDLHASINGDCYLGEDSELAIVRDLLAATGYVSSETNAVCATPESEPEFTDEEVAMAEAPWSYVAPAITDRDLRIAEAVRDAVRDAVMDVPTFEYGECDSQGEYDACMAINLPAIIASVGEEK